MKSEQEKQRTAQNDARTVWRWLDETYQSTYADTAHITVDNVLATNNRGGMWERDSRGALSTELTNPTVEVAFTTSAVGWPIEWHERADVMYFERRFATPLIRAIAKDANKTYYSNDKESGSEGGGSIGDEGDDENAPSPKQRTKQGDSSEEIDDDLEDEHESDKGEEGDKSGEDSGIDSDSSEHSHSDSSEEDSDSFSSDTESEYDPNSDSGSSDDGRRENPTTRRPVQRAAKKSSELSHHISSEDIPPNRRGIRRALPVLPIPARSSSSDDSPVTPPLRSPCGSVVERSHRYEAESDRASDLQDEEEDSDGPPLSRYPRRFPRRAANRASRHEVPTAVHETPAASSSSSSSFSAKPAEADEPLRAVEESPEQLIDGDLESKEEGDEKEERDDALLPLRRNPRRAAREEDGQDHDEEDVEENFVKASPPRRNPRRTARRSVNYADTLKGPEEEDSSSSSNEAPDGPRSHDRSRIFDERREGPDDFHFDSDSDFGFDSDSDDKELLEHVEPVPIDPISDAVRRRYGGLFDYDRDFGRGETAEDRLRKGGLLRKLECGGEDEGPRKRRRRFA